MAEPEIQYGSSEQAFKALWDKLDALAKALESVGTDTLRVKSV